ncbi:four helix bundle protein [Tenacibaculum sp. FZY0031]|uniref:four helix bundle protein n=1 Tax=Tenacibaculum sp. FZY0031 TaxID=3116648 RepID=UPI002EA3FD8C|nr:four helix bundle protein [Tenacibaculum sp. FZY0031]
MKESIVQGKSFQFSLKIISLYKKLQQEKEFIISKQLLRSGTSIGANILSDIHELIRLLTAIVKTSQQNLTKI